MKKIRWFKKSNAKKTVIHWLDTLPQATYFLSIIHKCEKDQVVFRFFPPSLWLHRVKKNMESNVLLILLEKRAFKRYTRFILEVDTQKVELQNGIQPCGLSRKIRFPIVTEVPKFSPKNEKKIKVNEVLGLKK